MAPTRTPKTNSSGVPGVQKIKSLIRQTTRLLAKEKLGADVRVENERKLKSLQADLEKAQLGRKEREMAVRYHKVKFFERQKALRKINQTKRLITEVPADDKKARRKLEKTLFEQRVDLNYILHFPKLRKYVSLFASSSEEAPAPDPARDEIRKSIRTAMKEGELEGEPELHIGSAKTGDDSMRWDPAVDGEDDAGAIDDQEEEAPEDGTAPAPSKSKKPKEPKSKKPKSAPVVENLTLTNDDFFDND